MPLAVGVRDVDIAHAGAGPDDHGARQGGTRARDNTVPGARDNTVPGGLYALSSLRHHPGRDDINNSKKREGL